MFRTQVACMWFACVLVSVSCRKDEAPAPEAAGGSAVHASGRDGEVPGAPSRAPESDGGSAVPPPTFEVPDPPAALVESDVRATVRGSDFAMPYAFAMLERGNESIRVMMFDRPLPKGDNGCPSEEAGDASARVLAFSVASGPGSDFFRGSDIAVTPRVRLPPEGEWRVGTWSTNVRVLQFDFGARRIEGEFVVAHALSGRARFDYDEDAGSIEGLFHASVCLPKGVPAEVKPSVPPFGGEPFRWTEGDRQFSIGAASAHFGVMGEGLGDVLEIMITSGASFTDLGLVGEDDAGFQILVSLGIDDSVPVGVPVPANGGRAMLAARHVGVREGTDRGVHLGPADAAVVIEHIGDWMADGVVRGRLSVDMTAELPNAVEGGPPIVVPIRGTGTFEAKLGGPDLVD